MGWSWFKFDNLGLTQGANMKFYTNVAKGLKLKVRKFWGLIPTFVEVTGKKLGGEWLFGKIPQKPVNEKFYIHEPTLRARNFRRKFIKNLLPEKRKEKI